MFTKSRRASTQIEEALLQQTIRVHKVALGEIAVGKLRQQICAALPEDPIEIGGRSSSTGLRQTVAIAPGDALAALAVWFDALGDAACELLARSPADATDEISAGGLVVTSDQSLPFQLVEALDRRTALPVRLLSDLPGSA